MYADNAVLEIVCAHLMFTELRPSAQEPAAVPTLARHVEMGDSVVHL